jgi:hypothetical protein
MPDRAHDHQRAPVDPLPPLAAGGLPDAGPAIVTTTVVNGRRVSRVLRTDGTTFSVIVPPGGIDADETAGSTPWIHDDGPPRPLPMPGLERLAARIGLHLVSGRPGRPASA